MFRQIAPHQHRRVTYAELFFDLVFVFAITQISHTLLAHFTPLGVVQVTLLFLAVWWVWVYTTWITNWLDPEQTPVRLLLFAMMLGGLVLSTSIPTAFDGRGLWFAIAYAAMQVGKTIFLWVSTPPSRTLARLNAIRITAWLSMSAVFWIAGGLAEGQSRLVLWAIALGDRIYFAGGAVLDPPIRRVLGRGLGGRRRPHGRTLRAVSSSLHSANPSSLPARPSPSFPGRPRPSAPSSRCSPEASRCGGSISTRARKPAPRRFQDRANREGWRGWPIPICTCRSSPASSSRAVADELVLKHPSGHSDLKTVISAIGGPLLFLFGTILFKYSFRGFLQLSHGFGIIALCVLAWFAGGLSPLMLSILTTAIMIVVAVWESISLRSPANA